MKIRFSIRTLMAVTAYIGGLIAATDYLAPEVALIFVTTLTPFLVLFFSSLVLVPASQTRALDRPLIRLPKPPRR